MCSERQVCVCSEARMVRCDAGGTGRLCMVSTHYCASDPGDEHGS